MDELAETHRLLSELKEVPCRFLNAEEAKEFMNSFADPVVREILWTAYATLIFQMDPNGPDGQFDVLFLMRVLAKMLEDRHRLLRVLSGELVED